MTSPAGELSIQVCTHDGMVTAVDIASTRPQVADRLLGGQPAAAAVALVPKLFTVCGRAQAIAAELALQAARQAPADDPAHDRQRTRRLDTEIAQEFLWRALLDWPQAVAAQADKTPADSALLANLRRALGADPAGDEPATRKALRRAVEQGVLGGSAQAWFEHEHVRAFEIWIAQATTPAARLLAAVQRDGARHGAPGAATGGAPGGAPAGTEVPLLPALGDAGSLRAIAAALMADDEFARLPRFGDHPAETGAVARMASHPLVAALAGAFGRSTLTRLAARITELARIAAGGEPSAPLFGRMTLATEGGVRRGAGWVETARGALVHLIEVTGAPGGRDERIARYRILAPTEWNFHPRGALAAGLLGAHFGRDAELRQRAQWLVQALDPCVDYTLELRDA